MKPLTRPHPRHRRLVCALVLVAAWSPQTVPAHSAPAALAAKSALNLPPEAKKGIHIMYAGDPDSAIVIFRGMQTAQPADPLGFLLEAEARWWKIYCAACDLKWGMIDAWKRKARPGDAEYLALADKAIRLAEARLAVSDSAEMRLYAGLGWGLRVRLYGLREERRAMARAAVTAREHLLRAKQLDPGMADADSGIGLYDYYADALSSFVKVLRFFMGIPGGNRERGIREMESAMNNGELMNVDARFYLARGLRTYDLQYERAAQVLEPLTRQYPRNPLFLLLFGNLNSELNRTGAASRSFHAAEASLAPDAACAARVKDLAQSALAAASPR